jgi:hypothetical protein
MEAIVDAVYEHSSGKISQLDDQTLYLSVGGDVREGDLEPFFEALEPLVEKRSPARILIDATYLSETPLPLRWQILKRMRGLGSWVERMAIFGLSPRLEILLWILFTISRREDIRTFLWRHEAESWVESV